MIKRLATLTGGIKKHAKIGPQIILTDKIIQAARAHAIVNSSALGLTEVRHQDLPLANAFKAALSAPVTSRSGSSSMSFLTMGAHSSSA